MPKRSSIRKKPGPADVNQLAKSIVDQATGNAPPVEETPVGPTKILLLSAWGALAGLKLVEPALNLCLPRSDQRSLKRRLKLAGREIRILE
jgi:hypothetical protein